MKVRYVFSWGLKAYDADVVGRCEVVELDDTSMSYKHVLIMAIEQELNRLIADYNKQLPAPRTTGTIDFYPRRST